jgi:hypothetical protein
VAGGPGMGLGSTLPVSRRLFSQRLIEGKEIPKILATSSRGIPRSTASNTFSLRSFEYALMRNSFAEDQLWRKPLSEGVCESMLPEGGIPLVAEIYSGELRVVNDVGVSLTLLTSREKDEGAFYLGGDTFFHGTP